MKSSGKYKLEIIKKKYALSGAATYLGDFIFG
jgi:hypothetical protein